MKDTGIGSIKESGKIIGRKGDCISGLYERRDIEDWD